ncbi:MAG: alpha/beta hydrolase [Burkholderiales bacterium]
MNQAPNLVEVDWCGRAVRIEVQWLAREKSHRPLLIFLHEGLGSVAMWKDFPQHLCAAANCRGLVYSRPGYGRSTQRSEDEIWNPNFMHRQAYEVLPALLQALGHDSEADPPTLFGHSDGGSIALLYAARFPARVASLVVVAPHILVEDISVASIERARTAYLEPGLRQRLGAYHDDPDSAFWGWNRIWLDPRFRDWSIADEIAPIRCPVLAIQGADDEYGTLQQIHGIAQRLPQTQLLELPDCGHSPHRDQPDRLISAVTDFLNHHHTKGDTP